MYCPTGERAATGTWTWLPKLRRLGARTALQTHTEGACTPENTPGMGRQQLSRTVLPANRWPFYGTKVQHKTEPLLSMSALRLQGAAGTWAETDCLSQGCRPPDWKHLGKKDPQAPCPGLLPWHLLLGDSRRKSSTVSCLNKVKKSCSPALLFFFSSQEALHRSQLFLSELWHML